MSPHDLAHDGEPEAAARRILAPFAEAVEDHAPQLGRDAGAFVGAAMSAAQTVRAYKDLARVERAFRTLKRIDLQIRPVHHWLEPRVRAHVFLCMLAYYVEWHLREAWAPLLFADHDRASARQEQALPVASAEISQAAQRKRGRRRSDVGVPVSSWRDLLAHLATQTLNTVAAPQVPNATFTLLSKPTPLQTAAFDLLATPLPRVQ